MAKHYGVDIANTIAIGDGRNDIEMLEYAGLGEAMKNAHKDLLKVADIVTKHTHKQGGLGKFLEEHLQLNK